MPGPRATRGYARMAAAAAAEAANQLTPAGKRCLDEAEQQSRQLDDNHVGTEHIVLGVLAGDRGTADKLARHGLTQSVFRAQLFAEPGPSPHGHIPLTPRAQMVLGFARGAAAYDGGAISPKHLILGVIAESRDWRSRGFDGPHHLEQAAAAVGTSLATIRSALSRP